jgi:hypothetical protein
VVLCLSGCAAVGFYLGLGEESVTHQGSASAGATARTGDADRPSRYADSSLYWGSITPTTVKLSPLSYPTADTYEFLWYYMELAEHQLPQPEVPVSERKSVASLIEFELPDELAETAVGGLYEASNYGTNRVEVRDGWCWIRRCSSSRT